MKKILAIVTIIITSTLIISEGLLSDISILAIILLSAILSSLLGYERRRIGIQLVLWISTLILTTLLVLTSQSPELNALKQSIVVGLLFSFLILVHSSFVLVSVFLISLEEKNELPILESFGILVPLAFLWAYGIYGNFNYLITSLFCTIVVTFIHIFRKQLH